MASNRSPEVNAITTHTHPPMLALSNEPMTVAGILLGKGFISEEIMSKVLVVSYTLREKATILIEAVRNKIELAPSKFTELLEILSEVMCAKELLSACVIPTKLKVSLLHSVASYTRIRAMSQLL